MIPVFIDTRDVSAEFDLSKEQVEGLIASTVKGITARFAKNWDNAAKSALKSTRQLYRSSIVVGEQGPYTGYVMLVNKLPNMLESGASPYDMKAGFANSSKKKTTKSGGWYLTIPFRAATPGALGESEVFSSIMPQSVYAVVKQKQSRATSIGGATRQGQGLKVNEIPAPHQIPRTRAMIVTKNKTFEEYKHKHSVFEGMQKSTKTYQSANQSQYVTFRRVGSGSDKNSWIHKGLEARRLAEVAMNNTDIPHEVDMLVDNELAKLGF